MPQIPPTPFGPLAGLKVIELGQLIAGPFAGKTLGDFGAEVIKIEPPASDGKPGGDPLRLWRMLHQGTSVWWQVQSRNKKSVALDLKDPQSRDIVRRLIDEADIVVENFKPGVMEAWGMGYEDLASRNPGLILCRINEQPLSLMRRAGFDAELGAHNIHADLSAALASSATTAAN